MLLIALATTRDALFTCNNALVASSFLLLIALATSRDALVTSSNALVTLVASCY